MVGTCVRSWRQAFAFADASLMAGRSFSHQRLWVPDILLTAFVTLQIVECTILAARETLDLGFAACLSASLLVVARLYAAQRNATPEFAHVPSGPAPALLSAPSPSSTPLPKPADGPAPTQAWADLMARISHEIRTPLNAVIGFSHLMEREMFGPLGHPRYASYAAHIKDSGEALLKSAEDTLALSSLLAAARPCERPQVSDIASLIGDAWRSLEAQAARRGVVLDAPIPAGLDIAGDRRAFRQIILNLMTEGLNRAADASRITVGVRSQGDVLQLCIAAPQPRSSLRDVHPSLEVCVSRALLERLGAQLVTAQDNARPGWYAMTQFDLCVQDDLFNAETCH